jgi:phage shock protein C
MNVTLVRLIAVVILVVTGLWPTAVVYLVAGVLMRPKPVVPFENDADKEFYFSYTASRPMALHRLKQTFDNLERRLRRMEDIVTAKDYDWESRLND